MNLPVAFERIGIGEARVEIEIHCAEPARVAQRRGRTETAQTVLACQVFNTRRQGEEISMTAKQHAIMAQAVRAELKTQFAQTFDATPVNRVLIQRQVPARTEPQTIFELGHRFHSVKAG